MKRRDFIKNTSMQAASLAVLPMGLSDFSPQFADQEMNSELYNFFKKEFPKRLNQPAGNIKYPYIDPGAAYASLCWDWDAYFSLKGLAPFKNEVADYAVGCVKNFLHFQAEDGSIPYAVNPKTPSEPENRAVDSVKNSCKPLLAQFALLAYDYSKDLDFLKASYPGIVRHCAHWESTQQTKLGLFTFRSHRGSGVDDHPAVFCRPLNSSVDVYLNSLFVKEYEGLETICQILQNGEEQAWKDKKEQLTAAINKYLWDPIDEMYYNVEVGYKSPGKVNQEVTWVVPLKIKSWTSFMPLWAGVAPKAYANKIVKKHLSNEKEFWSPNGMRSLAKNEPAYEIAIGYNPSCWRGPIWVVNNYLIHEGLMAYGFKKEAKTLAKRLKNILAKDIQENGCLHEYYHPETGKGLTHPGFINWNTLSLLL